MTGRILMQASGSVRPLRFSASGPRFSTQDATGWAGLPIEVLPLRDWEGQAEVGPLNGAVGVMVYLRGRVEFLARGRSRDRSWVARAGDVAIVSGDDLTPLLRCRGEAEVAAVDLSAAWLWAALGDKRPALPSALPPEAQRRLAGDVAKLLRDAQRSAPLDRLEVEEASFRLISRLLEEPAGRDAPREAGSSPKLSAATCRRLQDYVRAHLDRPVSHGELADIAGLTPRRFSTAFRRAFGTTAYQYVLRVRLREGARLMRSSRHSLAEIAYELGFSSQSHFSTAFRHAFQVQPRAYVRGWRRTIAGRRAPAPSAESAVDHEAAEARPSAVTGKF